MTFGGGITIVKGSLSLLGDEEKLFDDYNIFTVPIDDDRGIRGVRVSPNLYSTIEDIDKFIEAMLRIAA